MGPFIKGGEGGERRPWPHGCCQDGGPGAVQALSCMGPQLKSRRPQRGFPGLCCPSARRVLLLLHGWVDNQVASLASGQRAGLVGLSSPHKHQQPLPQNSLPVPTLQEPAETPRQGTVNN